MSNYFSKLPNNLVWCVKKEEVALCKDNNKLLAVIVYLDTHNSNITNECYFSLADIITLCDMKVDSHKGKSVDKFKEILKYLQQIKWLSEFNVDKLKPTEFVKCKFQITYLQDDADNDTQWFKLYYDKYTKIMNNESKLDKLITLKVYCYILSRIKRNSSEKTLEDAREYKNHDGVLIETFYDTYTTICKDLGISKNQVLKQHLDLLVDLDLIAYGNIGMVKKDNFTHLANNCYCQDEEELKRALDFSTKYYINEGYILTGKDVKNVSKKLKGLKGASQKLENKGQDNTHIKKEIKQIEAEEKEKAIKEAKENKNKAMGLKNTRPRRGFGNPLENKDELIKELYN